MALSSSVLLPLQILFLLAIKARSDDIPLTYCGNTYYTSGSPYDSNLRSLVTRLATSTWNSSSFFSTGTIGSSPETQIFGLAQCRPDASAATCFNCLNISVTAAAQNCPLRKSAAIRRHDCVFRYSDQRFFSMLEETLMVYAFNLKNASDPVAFNESVRKLMTEISLEASRAESRFSVGVANYSELGDIYGMAWCTQDLSSSDCSQCLGRAEDGLPTWSVGGWFMMVSCVTRFETRAFFSLSSLPPQPPPPPYTPPPLRSLTPPSTVDGAYRIVQAASSSGNDDRADSMPPEDPLKDSTRYNSLPNRTEPTSFGSTYILFFALGVSVGLAWLMRFGHV